MATEKLLQNPGALCNMVKRVALAAGEVTLKYFEDIDSSGLEEKADGSPVSLADREAEELIEKSLREMGKIQQLLPVFPGIELCDLVGA